jgi:hypothetical protein
MCSAFTQSKHSTGWPKGCGLRAVSGHKIAAYKMVGAPYTPQGMPRKALATKQGHRCHSGQKTIWSPVMPREETVPHAKGAQGPCHTPLKGMYLTSHLVPSLLITAWMGQDHISYTPIQKRCGKNAFCHKRHIRHNAPESDAHTRYSHTTKPKRPTTTHVLMCRIACFKGVH